MFLIEDSKYVSLFVSHVCVILKALAMQNTSFVEN